MTKEKIFKKEKFNERSSKLLNELQVAELQRSLAQLIPIKNLVPCEFKIDTNKGHYTRGFRWWNEYNKKNISSYVAIREDWLAHSRIYNLSLCGGTNKIVDLFFNKREINLKGIKYEYKLVFEKNIKTSKIILEENELIHICNANWTTKEIFKSFKEWIYKNYMNDLIKIANETLDSLKCEVQEELQSAKFKIVDSTDRMLDEAVFFRNHKYLKKNENVIEINLWLIFFDEEMIRNIIEYSLIEFNNWYLVHENFKKRNLLHKLPEGDWVHDYYYYENDYYVLTENDWNMFLYNDKKDTLINNLKKFELWEINLFAVDIKSFNYSFLEKNRIKQRLQNTLEMQKRSKVEFFKLKNIETIWQDKSKSHICKTISLVPKVISNCDNYSHEYDKLLPEQLKVLDISNQLISNEVAKLKLLDRIIYTGDLWHTDFWGRLSPNEIPFLELLRDFAAEVSFNECEDAQHSLKWFDNYGLCHTKIPMNSQVKIYWIFYHNLHNDVFKDFSTEYPCSIQENKFISLFNEKITVNNQDVQIITSVEESIKEPVLKIEDKQIEYIYPLEMSIYQAYLNFYQKLDQYFAKKINPLFEQALIETKDLLSKTDLDLELEIKWDITAPLIYVKDKKMIINTMIIQFNEHLIKNIIKAVMIEYFNVVYQKVPAFKNAQIKALLEVMFEKGLASNQIALLIDEDNNIHHLLPTYVDKNTLKNHESMLRWVY